MNFGTTSNEFNAQWRNPNDVFSVLLIVDADVVNHAIAQLAGTWLTPVAFSFGWVAYAMTALGSTIGEKRLMPSSPDYACIVINADNGYARSNNSWIIGRLVRDFDTWMTFATRGKLEEILEEKRLTNLSRISDYEPRVSRPSQAGLCVSIYEVDASKKAGVPDKDMVYWSGFFIAFLQLGIAMIPLGLDGNWGIAIITMSGILLSFVTGSLSQWKKEKWSCRRNTKKTFILTKGNGAQHAIVVLGNGEGLDLEDLASGTTNEQILTHFTTRIVIAILAVLWISLLITAAGQKSGSWYLMAIGGLGIIQNISVAGWRRQPGALGIHLRFREAIGHPKVMDTLIATEERHTKVGRSMLSTFFPNDLDPKEQRRWDDLKRREARQETFGDEAERHI
ncbi:hypothetical protein CPB86DRAFT_759392 [Serendipita vermifera]|nr:hypothetical protein CPB86DRAFT_759392 [Serendipita vermifera]